MYIRNVSLLALFANASVKRDISRLHSVSDVLASIIAWHISTTRISVRALHTYLERIHKQAKNERAFTQQTGSETLTATPYVIKQMRN